MSIEELREELDFADMSIVNVLCKRKYITNRIAQLKSEEGMELYFPIQANRRSDFYQRKLGVQGKKFYKMIHEWSLYEQFNYIQNKERLSQTSKEDKNKETKEGEEG